MLFANHVTLEWILQKYDFASGVLANLLSEDDCSDTAINLCTFKT